MAACLVVAAAVTLTTAAPTHRVATEVVVVVAVGWVQVAAGMMVAMDSERRVVVALVVSQADALEVDAYEVRGHPLKVR